MRIKDERLAWADAKLRECRRIALRYFRSSTLRVEHKADRSPVTIADRKIEEYLRKELAKAFPHDAIVGEEFGTSMGPGLPRRAPPGPHPSGLPARSIASASRPLPGAAGDATFWTIDPIDGTRAFSRGLFSWGILLGRVERGRAVFAACDFPLSDTFLGVAPGTPAFERHENRVIRLARANRPAPLSRAVISHGGSQWWLGSRYERGFARVVRRCYLERAFGDCHAYLWCLRGKVDVVMDYGVKLWDLVPFAALAEATGRVLVDFAGQPSFTGPESLLAHPTLARTIIKLLRTPNDK